MKTCVSCERDLPLTGFHDKTKRSCRECVVVELRRARAMKAWEERHTENSGTRVCWKMIDALPEDLREEAREFMEGKVAAAKEKRRQKSELFGLISKGKPRGSRFTEGEIRQHFTKKPHAVIVDLNKVVQLVMDHQTSLGTNIKASKGSKDTKGTELKKRKLDEGKEQTHSRAEKVRKVEEEQKKAALHLSHLGQQEEKKTAAHVRSLREYLRDHGKPHASLEPQHQETAPAPAKDNQTDDKVAEKGKEKQEKQEEKKDKPQTKKKKRKPPPTQEQLTRYRATAKASFEALTPEEKKTKRKKAAKTTAEWRVKHGKTKAPVGRAESVVRMIHMTLHEKDPLNQQPNIFKEVEAPARVFIEKLLDSACTYCGGSAQMSIDRIDSDLSYTMDNITPCCNECNMAKNCLPVSEYVRRCKAVAAYRHTAADDGKKCYYCGEPDPTSPDRRVAGSDYTPENVDMTCIPCNYLKKMSSSEDFRIMCKRVTAYQRQTPWSAGFSNLLVEMCKAAAEKYATDNAAEIASSVKHQPFKLQKKKAHPYKVGREPTDTVVYTVAYNKIYHTPPEATTYSCLKKELKGTPQKKLAGGCLKNGYRPCRRCRREVTQKEFDLLQNFSSSTGKIALAAKKAVHVNEKIYTKDEKMDTSARVLASADDPYYHSEKCHVDFTKYGVVYKPTALAQIPKSNHPCRFCRQKLSSLESIPLPFQLVQTNAIRKRIQQRLCKAMKNKK